MKQLFQCWLLLASYQTVLAQPLTVRQLIDKTYAAYRAANTYQDTGEVVIHHQHKAPTLFELGDITVKQPFQTAFIRKTSQFRFQYEHTKPKKPEIAYVIWSDGKRVKTWNWMARKVEEDEPLQSATRIAVGVSLSSSVRVPSLLLGFDALNWNLKDLQKLVLLPQTVVAGKTCYHLQGTIERHPVGATAKSTRPIVGPTESHPDIQLWIDTTTFFIIRIAELYNQGTTSHEYSITYYPLLNQPIKPEALVFDYKRFR